MIQGTSSDCGKTTFVTALCRIFKEDGINVSPFKAQNISLNSYVDINGNEFAWSQYIQAIASKTEPNVYMNPILLKPQGNGMVQLIVLGKIYKTIHFSEYENYKKEMKKVIIDSFNYLSNKFDAIIIEGAGSPAEINIKDKDISNMWVAKNVNSNVLLVSDIDRGGAFASLYGTYYLMEDEKDYIKGFIINKFRGEKKLLNSGLLKLEKLTGIPTLGVIPWIDIKYGDEDGASLKNKKIKKSKINIYVIKIPSISNFTDFAPFNYDENVNLEYIEDINKIDEADMIIIPGSKNTIRDLRWMKEKGFFERIKCFKGIVFGICGGFQIMGKEIIDVYGLEIGEYQKEKGFGFFNFTTRMLDKKITKQFRGKYKGIEIYGYEIHIGESNINTPVLNIDNKYIGTYIHGIFNSGEFRKYILNLILKNKNMNIINDIKDYEEFQEKEIIKLSNIVRENIELKKIYKIAGGN
ncbi:cobyric acid synthase [Marinitoga sp. 38H-ov]|uniref:cobyric acid synthase n=1 Tax=Marinitoga sp. 38H-ov TaxID=1755814 RepID=UPI001F497F51|nr:cobyric acid synthase [Marinitoga sp. 38H-ov]